MADGKEYNVVEPIINEFLNIINEFGQKDDLRFNYIDMQEINSYEPNVFKLKYKPIETSIELLINNVDYYPKYHFIYNKSTNSLVWKFTEENGGFDLDSKDYKVVIKYNYLKSEQD